MTKLDKNEVIVKYILKSLGNINPCVGEKENNNSLNNLELAEMLYGVLIYKLRELSLYKDSKNESEKKIGQKAYEILSNYEDVYRTKFLKEEK